MPLKQRLSSGSRLPSAQNKDRKRKSQDRLLIGKRRQIETVQLQTNVESPSIHYTSDILHRADEEAETSTSDEVPLSITLLATGDEEDRWTVQHEEGSEPSSMVESSMGLTGSQTSSCCSREESASEASTSDITVQGEDCRASFHIDNSFNEDNNIVHSDQGSGMCRV